MCLKVLALVSSTALFSRLSHCSSFNFSSLVCIFKSSDLSLCFPLDTEQRGTASLRHDIQINVRVFQIRLYKGREG